MEKRTGKLIVLSSQGTLFLNTDMQDYAVTSILSTFFSESQITDIGSDIALEAYCTKFFREIARMYDNCPKHEHETSATFCFESVVKNRTTAWGIFHSEFAISYPESFLKFLGVSICHAENMTFYPHFILNNTVFTEPLWWKVTSSNQVNSMVEMLGQIIYGETTPEQFFQRFPYANKGRINRFLDYEGFIIYSECPLGYEYNKIKTEPYYISMSAEPYYITS